MKKMLSLISIIVALMILSSCGNSSQEKPKDNTNVSSNATQDTITDNSSVDNDVALTATYQVPLKNIFVNVPNYQEIEQGYTELFIIHDSRYVAITADRRNATAKNSKEAHEIAFAKFSANMSNYEGGVNDIKISKDEEVQINGIDIYSFEGTINYGTDTKFDGYAKGYSFVLDGVPCEIIGSVIDKSQDKELIREIEEIVSEMIKTVRTEE